MVVGVGRCPDGGAGRGRGQVKMVTGDQLAIAVETSRRLGLGTNIMEGKQLMQGKTLGTELMTQVNEVPPPRRSTDPGIPTA